MCTWSMTVCTWSMTVCTHAAHVAHSGCPNSTMLAHAGPAGQLPPAAAAPPYWHCCCVQCRPTGLSRQGVPWRFSRRQPAPARAVPSRRPAPAPRCYYRDAGQPRLRSEDRVGALVSLTCKPGMHSFACRYSAAMLCRVPHCPTHPPLQQAPNPVLREVTDWRAKWLRSCRWGIKPHPVPCRRSLVDCTALRVHMIMPGDMVPAVPSLCVQSESASCDCSSCSHACTLRSLGCLWLLCSALLLSIFANALNLLQPLPPIHCQRLQSRRWLTMLRTSFHR